MHDINYIIKWKCKTK